MAIDRQQLRARLLATFRGEAVDLLAEIEANLRPLETGEAEAGPRLEATFRAMHTLKGAARSVNLREVEALCQACETVLGELTRGARPLDAATPALLQQARRTVQRLLTEGPQATGWRELIAQLERRPATAAVRPDPAPPPLASVAGGAFGATAESIRIDTAQLDRLILRSEELLAPKLAAEQRVAEAKALLPLLSRGDHLLQAARAAAPARRLDEAAEAMQEGVRLAGNLLGGLADDRRVLDATIDSLIEEMRRLRMLPAQTILELFPDMVRDLARDAGKEIVCLLHGGHLAVDRKVLQAVREPLIHLVRNAVDHAIEPPAERTARGKPAAGSIRVVVEAREGARIEIRVEDDGAGIDVAAVRAAAVRRRLVAAEAAEQLSEDQAIQLIFRSALSTSPVVTDLSGHGLGLAIVAERVEQLGGAITVETRQGGGACFRITVPASIASFHGLLVRAGERLFLLPLDAVEGVVRLSPDALGSAAGRPIAQIAGAPVACLSLAEALGCEPSAEAGAGGSFVLVRAGEQRAALRVDAVLGNREVLPKPLQPPLLRVRNVASVGLLPSGDLALILRPSDLLKSLRRAAAPAPARPARTGGRQRRTILVVDDSITTRAMEKNLFEALGYRVRVAADGLDAWDVLASEAIDIVVSDIDMPRLNGFELTARIRADRRLSELPVVLVTALEAREDKEQGLRVGANAYVVKSSLDATSLQEIVERLV